METLKFKVGDKVRVKPLEWYNSKKNIDGNIMEGRIFTKDMIEYCGKILTIEAVCGNYYDVEGNSKYWQDWMLEDETFIKEEKPKFDPKSLQAFDIVLVRNKEGDKWRCNLFCHIKEELGFSYFCIYDNWKYCIPYNEETKHLHNTTNEEPEYYKIWE